MEKKVNKKHYHSFENKFATHVKEECEVKDIFNNYKLITYWVDVCGCGLVKMKSKIKNLAN